MHFAFEHVDAFFQKINPPLVLSRKSDGKILIAFLYRSDHVVILEGENSYECPMLFMWADELEDEYALIGTL